MSSNDKTELPDDAALATMTTDELLALGGSIDGVNTVFKEPRWPVEGTRAEKRAERRVAAWFLAGGGFGLALLLVFLFWPWEYAPLESPDGLAYSLATPLYGLTFGLSVLCIAVGAGASTSPVICSPAPAYLESHPLTLVRVMSFERVKRVIYTHSGYRRRSRDRATGRCLTRVSHRSVVGGSPVS